MSPTRLLHTMLRVSDLERSLSFYIVTLGMRLLRKEEYSVGQFTLAFVGYEDERVASVLELTYNWGRSSYEPGTAFGHIALAVVDIHATIALLVAKGVEVIRAPAPMTFSSSSEGNAEVIAFIEDPDGYRIELIETPKSGACGNP